MNRSKFWLVALCFQLLGSFLFAQEGKMHLFFLHNAFLETHQPGDLHPEFGKMEYDQILQTFEKAGFEVHSELRGNRWRFEEYVDRIANQVDSLLKSGVPASRITVVGTSRGGYLAQFVSDRMANPDLSFVFVAAHQSQDILEFRNLNWCGNILNIYDLSDPSGRSALAMKNGSREPVPHFRELELSRGLGHGFLFKADSSWLLPAILWAKGDYELTGLTKKYAPASVTHKVEMVYDAGRDRIIPVSLYFGESKTSLVLLSAGYGCSHTEYTYLARGLAAYGHFVAVIQHELEPDPPLPSGVDMVKARSSNWLEGTFSLFTVREYLKLCYPELRKVPVHLIGHSNGGDISMFYAKLHPQEVQTCISLDHRRMPIPRNKNLPVLTLRGNDFPADPGVLPSEEEQKEFPISVIPVQNTGHNYFRDNGTLEAKCFILRTVQQFLARPGNASN